MEKKSKFSVHSIFQCIQLTPSKITWKKWAKWYDINWNNSSATTTNFKVKVTKRGTCKAKFKADGITL